MGEEQILCVRYLLAPLGAGPRFPVAAGQAEEKQRAAHSELLRGPILQGLPKVKIFSDFSYSL